MVAVDKIKQQDTIKENKKLEVLVSNAINGDVEALHGLCESIAQSVLFRTKHILNNSMDAEDVSQNVLIRVCENIHTLRQPKAFKVWLSKIVTNEVRTHMTRNVTEHTIVNIDDYVASLVDESEELFPQYCVEVKEFRQDVMNVLSDLPTRQREAMLLYYYDQLSVGEIAKIMDIPHQSVSRYLALARVECGKKLKRSSYIDKTKAISIVPFGIIMTEVMKAETELLNPANMAWLQNAIAECEPYIAATASSSGALIAGGTVAVAATAAAATAVATTAETTTIAAAAAAGSSSGGFSFGAILGTVGAIVTTCAVVLGITLGSPSVEIDTGPPPALECKIVFEGGEHYRGTDRVNPKIAYVDIEQGDSEANILLWNIKKAGTEDMLLEGNGKNLDVQLISLHESQDYGEYILSFRIEQESGPVYTLSSNFYIKDLP